MLLSESAGVGMGAASDVDRVIGGYIDDFFAIRTVPQIDLWAADNVYLPRRVSAFEGFVNFDLTPWAREPVNSLNDPDVRNEIGIYGTQLSKTTQALVVLAAAVALRRQNVVWMWPSEGMGRSFSQSRWQPVVEASEALRKLKPSDGDLFKNLEQHFQTATVNFIGSHSRVQAKSRPAPIIIVDEVEDLAASTEKDTDPINLIQERTKTFTDAKHFIFGSPLLPDGPAWKHYELGDRRHYLVPCPDCQTRQALEFRGQVWGIERGTGELALLGKPGDFRLCWDQQARLDERTWDFEAVAKSAHYSCVCCGAKIRDIDKREMNLAGGWVPTCRAQAEGYRSRRINSLYPLWGATTFGQIATKFLSSHHTAGGAQNFINNWEARAYTRGIDLTDRDQLLARVRHVLGKHVKGERVGVKSILFADVQRAHLVWDLWAYDAAGGVHLSDFGYCPGFDELRDLDDLMKPDYVCLDGKYRAQQVYEAVWQRRHNWIALRGEESRKSRPLTPNFNFDPFTGDSRQGVFVITLLHLNADLWGEEVLARLYPEVKDEDAGTATDELPPKIRDLFLPTDIISHPDYYRQLFSEYIEEFIAPNGRKVRRWKRSKNNHRFDLAKWALAVGSFLGLTRIGADVSKKVADATAAAKAASQQSLALDTPRGGSALFNS